MALVPGTRIGQYEVTAKIGAGGMGEVYRAIDTSLGREVAIKVLPDIFANDADRLARFEREARTLASLNHSNIAVVYGLEQSGGSHALVMELVEGSTLADLVGQGPIVCDEALSIAKQIADALAVAHEQGIVHRDLKPANVKVRPDGTVKVLDFGLAKLVDGPPKGGHYVHDHSRGDRSVPLLDRRSLGEGGQPDLTMSPTITTPVITQAGFILGTAAYMSPEQARGKPVDKRADVWAFACVLYEMLSGERAFEEEDVSLTLSKVLQREPDFSALPREIPASIRQVLTLCLRKDPRQRVADMHDVRLMLDGAFNTPAPVAESAVQSARPSAWRLALMSAIVAALLVGSAVWFLKPSSSVARPGVVRFEIPPPSGGVFTGANGAPRMALSPDGRYLAFTANLGDGRPDQLWIRRLDSLEATQLTNITETSNEPVQQPFWSPDSRFIGFFEGGALKKVDVAGGVVQTLCSVPGNNFGGTWNEDGTILFGASLTNGLQRVPAGGGVPSHVTALDSSAKELVHLWPRFLPDGRHFLYQARGAPDEDTIYVGALDEPDRAFVIKSPYMVDFAQGHLLFIREGALLAQRFNERTLSLEGEPVPVADSVQTVQNGRAGFTVSGAGVLIYRSGSVSVTADSQLAWMDRSGREIGVVGPPAAYRGVELSPDGNRAVVHREERDGSGDLWVLDLERGSTSRLTFDATQHNTSPVWSPDSRRIFFSSLRGSSRAIVEKDSSGVGDERRLYQGISLAIPWSVSPDATTLLFSDYGPGAMSYDLSTVPLASEPSPSVYLRGPAAQVFGQVSPDGRWIAYASSESGPPEVYVQSFPKPETRYQVSTNGGSQPRWRRDGRELFYRLLSSQFTLPVMAVAVESAGSGLNVSVPRKLFDVTTLNHPHAVPIYNYAVSGDGQRFLVVRAPGETASSAFETPVTVVLNWDAALAR